MIQPVGRLVRVKIHATESQQGMGTGHANLLKLRSLAQSASDETAKYSTARESKQWETNNSSTMHCLSMGGHLEILK